MVIWILSAVVLNYLVGVFVCAAIDEHLWPGEDRLLKWGREMPGARLIGAGTVIVASLWPVILLFAIRYKSMD